MWRGVRRSSYRGGGLPLLTPSRNDNTTSPPSPLPMCMLCVCMYLFFLSCVRSLKPMRGIFFQRKGGGLRAWRGRTDVIFGSLGCAYIRESGSPDRCLKMGAPWTTEDRAVLLRAVSKYGCRWSLIASLNLIPGRSAKALRNEHSSLSTPPPLSTATCVYDVDAPTTWPSLTQSRYIRRPCPYYVPNA